MCLWMLFTMKEVHRSSLCNWCQHLLSHMTVKFQEITWFYYLEHFQMCIKIGVQWSAFEPIQNSNRKTAKESGKVSSAVFVLGEALDIIEIIPFQMKTVVFTNWLTSISHHQALFSHWKLRLILIRLFCEILVQI